jgi:hypothetical protein
VCVCVCVHDMEGEKEVHLCVLSVH